MTSMTPKKPANLWQRARSVYHEYPSQYWVVVFGTFIDRLGGAMLFPFFTLYVTRKFGVGMTQVGVIFGMFAISGLVGSLAGGALTDRLGRKKMLIFGLVTSALSSLLMGVISDITLFVAVAVLVGVLSETGGPAQQALIADLLPEEKRAEGFGILRVAFNVSVVIGPLIGGLLAARSYLLLFVSDAVTSLITAGIVYFVLKETYQPRQEGEAQESMAQTFRGYSVALRDTAFVWFLGASALMVLVYIQMNTTLAVYLRDVHGVNEVGFSYILSLNAAMVVLFQFWITRRITPYRPLIVMTVGTLLYAFGFAMYGFSSLYFMFLVAMVIITIGEMFVSPVGQAIVASLAPEDMRGRYMAVSGFSWVIPVAIGPLLAGLVMDNLDPRWVWYSAGILGVAAAGAFYLLEWRVGRSRWAAVEKRVEIIERLELGEISAEEASRQLEGVGEGSYARLAPQAPTTGRRHLRIRVSDLATGAMKVDLRLPVGLVNTVLFAGGHLSADLEEYSPVDLRSLIVQSEGEAEPRRLDKDDERMEVSIE